MKSTLILLYILGAASLFIFMYFRTRKPSPVSLLLKILTSLFFIGVGALGVIAYSHGPSHSMLMALEDSGFVFMAFMIIGAVFGLIGDIVLDLKVMYEESDAIYTYGGMTSFGIGHLFFIYANYIVLGIYWWAVPISVVVSAVIVLSAPLLKLQFKKFIVPVAAYSLLLTFLNVNSIFAMVNRGYSTVSVLFFTGAFLFLVSDLVLSLIYFGGNKKKSTVVVNYLFYYGAQFVLASIIYVLAVTG